MQVSLPKPSDLTLTLELTELQERTESKVLDLQHNVLHTHNSKILFKKKIKKSWAVVALTFNPST